MDRQTCSRSVSIGQVRVRGERIQRTTSAVCRASGGLDDAGRSDSADCIGQRRQPVARPQRITRPRSRHSAVGRLRPAAFDSSDAHRELAAVGLRRRLRFRDRDLGREHHRGILRLARNTNPSRRGAESASGGVHHCGHADDRARFRIAAGIQVNSRRSDAGIEGRPCPDSRRIATLDQRALAPRVAAGGVRIRGGGRGPSGSQSLQFEDARRRLRRRACLGVHARQLWHHDQRRPERADLRGTAGSIARASGRGGRFGLAIDSDPYERQRACPPHSRCARDHRSTKRMDEHRHAGILRHVRDQVVERPRLHGLRYRRSPAKSRSSIRPWRACSSAIAIRSGRRLPS